VIAATGASNDRIAGSGGGTASVVVVVEASDVVVAIDVVVAWGVAVVVVSSLSPAHDAARSAKTAIAMSHFPLRFTSDLLIMRSPGATALVLRSRYGKRPEKGTGRKYLSPDHVGGLSAVRSILD
jgi:hypothetical protein